MRPFRSESLLSSSSKNYDDKLPAYIFCVDQRSMKGSPFPTAMPFLYILWN